LIVENLAACRKAASMDLDDVATVVLTDVNDRTAVKPAPRRFVGRAKPSSALA
jgi:hypothetical protein